MIFITQSWVQEELLKKNGAADSPSKLQHHPCPKRDVDDLDPSCLCPISPKKEPEETWIRVTSGRAYIRELCFLRAHSLKGILNNSCKLSQSPHWNLSRRNQDVGKFEGFCWQMLTTASWEVLPLLVH